MSGVSQTCYSIVKPTINLVVRLLLFDTYCCVLFRKVASPIINRNKTLSPEGTHSFVVRVRYGRDRRQHDRLGVTADAVLEKPRQHRVPGRRTTRGRGRSVSGPFPQTSAKLFIRNRCFLESV